MRKVVALFDIHFPEQIDLSGVLDFVSDFKPHDFVLGGDIFDLRYFSRWCELSPTDLAGDKFEDDMAKGNKFLDAIEARMVKTGANKHFIIGNHEEWLDKFVGKFPYLNKVLSIERELHLKERGWKVYRPGSYVKVGRIFYVHGHYTNQYHAKKHLEIYGKNIRYGHCHDIQIHSAVSPIDFHRRLGVGVPCLCSMNPEFMHGRPNKWVNGFQYAYVRETGEFYEYVPIIQAGTRFIAEGKKYGKGWS